ncbi:MAG: DUF4912 domain-containing protein [Spirochaetes bacterium]|nr:DUF4912 domain-containing protein [Spirochaetota bacterium]
MTRDRLQSLSYSSLKEIAKKEGIANYQNLPVAKLIEAVIEALEEDRNERITLNNIIIRGEEKKFDIFRDEEIVSRDTVDYIIPETYNESKVHLMLIEPLLAYAYWDFSEKDRAIYATITKPEKLFLRVYEGLEIGGKAPSVFFDIPIEIKDENWYINLPHKSTSYYIKIILLAPDEEKVLCTSNVITSPPKTIEDVNESIDYDLSNEDMQLLAGFYKFDVEEDTPRDAIPQRIISFTDEKYLNDSDFEKKSEEDA